MKTVNFIYSSDQRFEEMLKANEISPDKENLVRIHTCTHSCVTIKPFIDKILSYLPNAKIIGSSTSGVICEGSIKTKCCLVSITDTGSASIKTCISPLSTVSGHDISGDELACNIQEQFADFRTDFMLAFFSRPYIKVGEFVDHVSSRFENLHIIGGIANTSDDFFIDMIQQHSFVFNESSVSSNGIVCAAIGSEKMSVFGDIVYVTEPIGKTCTITDADGMIIRTINGENAVEWYQQKLGINLSRTKNPGDITVVFPLVKANYSNIPWAVSYSPQTAEMSVFNDEPEPVLFVPSEVKVGDKIRISYSSIQKTIEVCENVCENISSHPAEVLFGYSCVSRQDMFSNCAKWELLPFKDTNLSGALVAGEIGNINNKNRYCNYSFAIAALSESNCRIKLNIKALSDNANVLVNNNMKILDYLLKTNSISDESQSEQQREIKSSLFIDDETGLGNITKFLYDFNIGAFDKMCMITIRNESLLTAFTSKSKFNLYFNRFHRTIMEFIGNSGYSCYIYKKTSLILTASPEISDDDFLNMITAVQNHIAEFDFASYVPVSEFAVVMHEDDMINKAELVLTRMRNKNLLFLRYTPDLGLEQFNAQKMKMIRILNDAISNKRIIPYFQGIHDNRSKGIRMYEALMRIEDSEGNIYTPYHFMDIAKEYGFYSDISYIMINKVMEMFVNRSDKVTINLNISDICNYKITHSIFTFLKSAPHPENFIFELTETEEITDYQIIFEFVDKIHSFGGSIAIDDFGSGFSNIVNVFKIKSDYIKIDGEIIKNISSDTYALEFLEMIALWAKKHSKEIIAEFVENDAIQQIVEKNSIHFSQGYLYSKPHRITMTAAN